MPQAPARSNNLTFHEPDVATQKPPTAPTNPPPPTSSPPPLRQFSLPQTTNRNHTTTVIPAYHPTTTTNTHHNIITMSAEDTQKVKLVSSDSVEIECGQWRALQHHHMSSHTDNRSQSVRSPSAPCSSRT